MLRITKNTFPVYPGVAHGEPGDLVQWEQVRANDRGLVRKKDGRSVWGQSRKSQHVDFPPGVGVIAENKKRGWIMILENAGNGEEK